MPLAASPAVWAQGERGDSTPLFCSGETPPGVLCPALEPSAQDRPGAVGAGPEEAPAMIRGAGTPLLGGKAGRAGAVQPGKSRLWGDLRAAASAWRGLIRKKGTNFLVSSRLS